MYQVILTGVHDGVVRSEAVKNLATLFKTTTEQVEKMLSTSGYVLKKGITGEDALKYKAAIEAAGASCRMDPEVAPVHALDVDLPQSLPNPEIPKNGKNLITCTACENVIAKTADNCPKCGAKNEWTDPRISGLLSFLRTNATTSSEFTFYSNRLLVWGSTEFTTKSFESLRYAGIALVIGIILNFLSRPVLFLVNDMGSIVKILVTFAPFIAYPVACFFFAKWIYHALFTSVANEILQKSFRVDFSGDVPVWQSNDDEFWMSIKKYVSEHNATK